MKPSQRSAVRSHLDYSNPGVPAGKDSGQVADFDNIGLDVISTT